jgi:hypothetical protein
MAKWKITHDRANTILSLLALLASFGAIILNVSQLSETRRATKAAEDSAAEAKRANLIAIGGLATEVFVEVVKQGPFLPREKPANIILWIHNRSEVTFSGVIIKAIPLAGFTYPLSTVEGVKGELKTTVVKVDLVEGLRPDGGLKLNLGALLASNVKTNLNIYELRNTIYSASYNIVVAPIKQGDSVGSRGGKEDRRLATVEFTPDQLPG